MKFFHPYLTYREIDWDKALMETLPKVNGAKTPQGFEAAVNQMFRAGYYISGETPEEIAKRVVFYAEPKPKP